MFIWGTDWAKCMAPLKRILVSCTGPVSNTKFFTNLLLLSGSVKSPAICNSASLPLWPEASTFSLWPDFPFPFPVVSQLFYLAGKWLLHRLKTFVIWDNWGNWGPESDFIWLAQGHFLKECETRNWTETSWLSISYFSPPPHASSC